MVNNFDIKLKNYKSHCHSALEVSLVIMNGYQLLPSNGFLYWVHKMTYCKLLVSIILRIIEMRVVMALFFTCSSKQRSLL